MISQFKPETKQVRDFEIVRVNRVSSELVQVLVRMDAKAWAKYRAQSDLGHLYGVAISNAVYRDFGVKAYCPMVGDKANARKGIKSIELTYQDSTWAPIDNVIEVDFKSRKILD